MVVPLARSYRPQLVLVSAGYDAHERDPLADCRVSDAGYVAMTRAAARPRARSSVRRSGCVLEGGYALGALARSVATTMSAAPLVDGNEDTVAPLAPVPVAAQAEEARVRLAVHWPGLW